MQQEPEHTYRYHRRYMHAFDTWLIIAEDMDTGVYWFPIRPACLLIGVDSAGQLITIRGNRRIAPHLQKIAIPTGQRSDGTWMNAQMTHCLPWRQFSWWMALVDRAMQRNLAADTSTAAYDKLVERQDAVMDLAEQVMNKPDEEVGRLRQRALARDVTTPVTGELYMECPVCGTHLCLQIGAAHLIPGEEPV